MDYFDQVPCHIQGQMDIDCVIENNCTHLATLGSDDTATIRTASRDKSILDGAATTIELSEGMNNSVIALSPGSSKNLLLSGAFKKVWKLSAEAGATPTPIHESLGNIYCMKYSHDGKFVALAG